MNLPRDIAANAYAWSLATVEAMVIADAWTT